MCSCTSGPAAQPLCHGGVTVSGVFHLSTIGPGVGFSVGRGSGLSDSLTNCVLSSAFPGLPEGQAQSKSPQAQSDSVRLRQASGGLTESQCCKVRTSTPVCHVQATAFDASVNQITVFCV